MKFLLEIILFLLISETRVLGKLTVIKSNKVTADIFQNIIKQHNFSGITVYSKSYGKQSYLKQAMSTILQTITKLSSVVSLNSHVNVDRLKISVVEHSFVRETVTRINGSNPNILANAKVLALLIVTKDVIDNSQKKVLYESFEKFSSRFMASANAPKLLIVHISRVNRVNYKRLLSILHNTIRLDIEILNLSVKIANRKAHLSFQVHQINHFTRVYVRQLYHSNVQWFSYKLKNLSGFPLKLYI